MNVLVLSGGPDAEHAVSLRSGAAVAAALRASGQDVHEHVLADATLDLSTLPGTVIFPVLHGPWGEGGPLQALLEQDGRPFVGCRSEAAALCMDKVAVKKLAREHDLPTPDWAVLSGSDHCPLSPPLVVKPMNEGSSVGLFMCDDLPAVHEAIEQLSQSHATALVEHRIVGRELTVGLLHGRALPLVEVLPADGTYDYDAKYERTDTRYVTNPDVDPETNAACTHIAESIGRLCGVTDLARVDLLLDQDRSPWLLEVNTMPGFTEASLFPMAAQAAGMDMPSLCTALVQGAVAGMAPAR
jgi:D-alanine-D-alanine ligase